ncbi:MAG: hypothetical protein OER56_02930 [Hyphomicrobiales bacterium]|nr:hypothetical protein [Hyphomicrobiales bacterium]
MKISKRPIIALLCAISWSMGTEYARADEVNWTEYMQDAYVVAAIAAAISLVDNCDKKLSITEIRPSADKRVLSFTCEETSILHLKRYGGSRWLPDRFDVAG